MRTMVRFTCEKCGKKTDGYSWSVLSGRRRFCGVSCANSARAKRMHAEQPTRQVGTNNPNYKGEKSLTPYQHKLRQIERHPLRVQARQLASDALRRGKIAKSSCEICGNVNTQMHHENYAEPLVIQWLCREHHIQLHNGRGTGS